MLGPENFFKEPVLFWQGDWFTVKQIVRCAAHVLGGVHAGTPEDEQEEKLLAADRALLINDTGQVAASMNSIGTVTVAGLRPLVDLARSRAGA